MITSNSLARIKAIPVYDVVSSYVKLDTHGKGNCPFHNEKSPSFSISPKRNTYKCFGCGESGDAIQFVQKMKNLSFVEAAEHVAEIGSVEVEFDRTIDRQALAKAREEKAGTRAVIADVQTLFLHYLWHNPEGESALNYLKELRGYDADTILQWGIGFNPDSYKLLVNRYGVDGRIPAARQAGIIDEKEHGPYDVFRGRITFPIHNPQGEIVSFAGRILPGKDKDPKYLNGSATSIYDKSRTLYGLYQSIPGIKRARYAILVEGYTDVISMHRAGADNTVATCGTALTPQQCRLLKQHTDNVVIIRDADDAGRKAIERDIPALLQAGIRPSVFLLPNKQDPDEFARQHSALSGDDSHSILIAIQEQKQDAIAWQLDRWKAELGNDDYDMYQLVEQLAPLLNRTNNPVLKQSYIDRVTSGNLKKKYGISGRMLKEAMGATGNAAKSMEEGSGDEEPRPKVPYWINVEEIDEKGFCTVKDVDGSTGYWSIERGNKFRITNFVMKPIFHVAGKGEESRHIIEVTNGKKTAVVDLKSKALISIDVLGSELVAEGNFVLFGNNNHLKRISAELLPHFHKCFEIRQPGWQREGFFVFLDRIIIPGIEEAIRPDRYGIFSVKDQHYLIPASSEVYSNIRHDSDPYELQRILTCQTPTVSFEEWSRLMVDVFGHKGAVGLAFLFVCSFRDIVFKVNSNCPHLYCYGERSSGKSALAECLTYFFFKDKRTFQLNAGTDFGFFAFMGAFRNCLNHMNEMDDKTVPDKWFHALKGAFDGEGRTKGVIGGAKNQIEVQHVESPLVITGQYISTKDDNSLVSRSIIVPFSENEITDETKKHMLKLKALQDGGGINGLLTQVLQLRPALQASYYDRYTEILSHWRQAAGDQAFNQRIFQNWCHLSTLWFIVGQSIKLPKPWPEFDQYCHQQALTYSRFIRSSDTLTDFWNVVAELNDNRSIEEGWHFRIVEVPSIKLRDKDGKDYEKIFNEPRKILLIRLQLVHGIFEEAYRRKKGERGLSFENLKHYTSNRDYYMGQTRSTHFQRFETREAETASATGGAAHINTGRYKIEKKTNAFAFDYDKLNCDLESSAPSFDGSGNATSKASDLPFGVW